MNVRIERTKSVLLKGMQDSILPVAIAHGEGYANLDDKSMADLTYHGQIALRYVDSQGNPTEHYPLNPNGSPQGITGICSNDGRVALMMPHPERTLRTVNHSWKPTNGPMMVHGCDYSVMHAHFALIWLMST